jgi:prepilin-type N-terminal cleavage/methylation domain-containing protein
VLLRWSKGQHGYTLLELVVVIFIIGLISAVILLRSGTVRFNRKVAVFAQQLQSFIQVCQQQAILQPALIGVMVQANNYQAYYFSQDQPPHWQALASRDSFWQPRQVPTDIVLRLSIAVPNNASGIAPQIVIQPSGDFTPFTIDIGYVGEAARFRVQGNDVGEILLQELA